MSESFTFTLLLTLTFLAAGLVKGVTGMGLPTVAMGLLGTAMPPAAAAALLVIPSFVTNVWQMLAGPALRPLWRRFWPLLLGVISGTLATAAWLVSLDPAWSSFWLGGALIVYAVYALLAPPLAMSGNRERWLSPVVGVITGIITGATGVFVMPAVPYLQALRLDKDTLVQALGLSFTVSTLALAAGLLLHGAFRLEQAGVSTLAVVPALIGMGIGQWVRARISAARFRQCFLGFLVVLGLQLATRPFL